VQIEEDKGSIGEEHGKTAPSWDEKGPLAIQDESCCHYDLS
jgi:hypothetical protein